MSLIDSVPTVLQNVSPEWISIAVDLLESIQAYVKQTSPEGLLEILEYESTLDLPDIRGRNAQLTKSSTVSQKLILPQDSY